MMLKMLSIHEFEAIGPTFELDAFIVKFTTETWTDECGHVILIKRTNEETSIPMKVAARITLS